MGRLATRGLSAAVALTAAFFLLQAAWIPAKAALGQWLLERAWRLTLETGEAHRPWPWADLAPMGVLEVPRLGVRHVIVAGASGRNLAWAPGTVAGEGPADDLVVSGHRDTHFRFLAELRDGDLLKLRTPGFERNYRVAGHEVVDSRLGKLVIETGASRLTLITCYPFDTLDVSGPLRYVVVALPAAGHPRPKAP